MSVMLLRSKGGGAAGEVTPAGDRVGVSMQADKSVCVVLLLFAGDDVRVLVAARFRTAGTSTGKVWTCA